MRSNGASNQSPERYCRYQSWSVFVWFQRKVKKHLISKKKKNPVRVMFVVPVLCLGGSSENCHTCYSLIVRRQQINNKYTYVGVCNGRIRKISLSPYLLFIKLLWTRLTIFVRNRDIFDRSNGFKYGRRFCKVLCVSVVHRARHLSRLRTSVDVVDMRASRNQWHDSPLNSRNSSRYVWDFW